MARPVGTSAGHKVRHPTEIRIAKFGGKVIPELGPLFFNRSDARQIELLRSAQLVFVLRNYFGDAELNEVLEKEIAARFNGEEVDFGTEEEEEEGSEDGSEESEESVEETPKKSLRKRSSSKASKASKSSRGRAVTH